MTRVKATQNLRLEDVPKEHRDWAGKIIQVVNDFFSQCINIVNGGILFSDNVLGVEHEFSFRYQSDAISLPVGFQWTLAQMPRALQVVSAVSGTNTPINVSVGWTYTAKGQVQLTSIVQFTSAPAIALLTAGTKYKITVRVTP